MSPHPDETTGSRLPQPLDWIDVLLHAAITFCVATLGAGLAHDAGFDLEVPIVFAVVAASLALLAWRRQRARAGAPLGSDDRARLHEIEDRLAQLEQGQDRVLDLEERIDFAERLLAKHQQPDRIPGS